MSKKTEERSTINHGRSVNDVFHAQHESNVPALSRGEEVWAGKSRITPRDVCTCAELVREVGPSLIFAPFTRRAE